MKRELVLNVYQINCWNGSNGWIDRKDKMEERRLVLAEKSPAPQSRKTLRRRIARARHKTTFPSLAILSSFD